MANEMPKAILDGALGGIALGGSYMGLKYLISRYLENKRLDKLKDTVAKELRKQDIQLKGNIFKDVYPKEASFNKKAADDWSNLPLWAALLTSGALAAGGTVYGLQGLMNGAKAETPEFAERYRAQQKRKFLRAAKLLRAVTDDATMRDIDLDKTASVKTAGIAEDVGSWFVKALAGGTDIAALIGKKSYEGMYDSVTDFIRGATKTKIAPSLAALGLVGAGGIGLYALRKLLKRQAEGKRLITAQDDAVNAWLSQRKESGEANRTLNAFVGRNDRAERDQLNKILKRYEEKYAPADLNALQV